ncbi:AzlD domain-containing protein [Dactylosporangium sp. AC04546]|uniref:AzlD domain-containing protein n=1 Tax=Dactylosporangium sp. AC04546 TaxID=2862460 RepID=UPI001EDD6C3F|nr:AzlD domain-containing protein [Dactylosporangium sp. AC04546]WVK84148.1 AzlD domain-containing protein [Dactylosporangium sp. AC04546]
MSWVVILALAAGTYALRLAGPVLRERLSVSETVKRYLTLAAVALLAALIGTAALLDGTEFVGIARPAGVLVGAVLAWRKAPFVVVVVAAALTAALLRLAGVR